MNEGNKKSLLKMNRLKKYDYRGLWRRVPPGKDAPTDITRAVFTGLSLY